MTTDTISVERRIVETDAELATLTAGRSQVGEAIEDALAAGGTTTAFLDKDAERIDKSIKRAQAARRGLERLRILEQRDAHRLSTAEAETLKTEAVAKFHALVATRDEAAEELGRLERDVIRWGYERDSAAERHFRRQTAYTTFCSANADAIARAEQLAEHRTADDSATEGKIAS